MEVLDGLRRVVGEKEKEKTDWQQHDTIWKRESESNSWLSYATTTKKYPFLHDNEERQTEVYCFNIEHVSINACHLIVLVCLRLFFTHEYSLLFSFRIFTAFFFFSLVALHFDSPRLGLGILSRDGLSVCLCALTEVNLGWKTHPSARCLSSSSNVFIIFHVELIYQQDKRAKEEEN